MLMTNNIRIYILPGFEIAKKATDRGDLQLRMQGNTFLGAFFRVSPFLKFNGISEELFLTTVKKQYVKKFGRFGDAVVASNDGTAVHRFHCPRCSSTSITSEPSTTLRFTRR